ncbi:MAG: helix-turn-helix transcriptional regulator [Acidaminococcaceae bacterium]|nr:helix-turn-helix transcriptional regulator [Acidaminococcaceae bacterium]
MLSETIQQLRYERNWSQTDLANRLGITRAAINSWEMGLTKPALSMLVKLSYLFGVTTDYLLGIEHKKLINISHLSQKDIQLVYEIIDRLNLISNQNN